MNWKAQFGYIEYNVEGNENRGHTAGIIGFTSRTHDMLELVEHYQKVAPGNALTPYLPILKKWTEPPRVRDYVRMTQGNLPLGVRSRKAHTGLWAMGHNAELNLGIPGKVFGMREYWDRYIRDKTHLRRTVDYIHNNPVPANLCQTPQDWPWSAPVSPWERRAEARQWVRVSRCLEWRWGEKRTCLCAGLQPGAPRIGCHLSSPPHRTRFATSPR